jgi:type I restriction enzyme M protein
VLPNAKHLATRAIRGVELVEEVARLATMNLLLHGISGQAENELPISCADSLASPPKEPVNVVVTNPPFGVKGSVTYSSGDGRRPSRSVDELTVVRADFPVQTANKQLNFLQHVVSLLRPGGRAAVVVPDNVLFESGAAASIRRRLLETCEVHTLLRLPTGLFYAQGVKANVLFFDRRDPRHPTKKDIFWVYDLRSDNRFTLKAKPLRAEDLLEFVELYRPNDGRARAIAKGKDSARRWRSFDVAAILRSNDCRFDLAWSDEPTASSTTSTERLDMISCQITEDLERALALLRTMRSN